MSVAQSVRDPIEGFSSYPELFIGGGWTPPVDGSIEVTIDPTTEEPWAEFPMAGPFDIDRAVDAARAALGGPWRTQITASERGKLLMRLAGLVERDADRLAAIESHDNGKPYRDTKSEMARAVSWLEYFAGMADKIGGREIPFRPGALAYTRLEPVGVVGAVLPWNSPLLLTTWKLGPALAAGNTIVIKPSELTPISALELARLCQEAGFPDGVVNVVPGDGATAGSRLSAHPGVDKIAFTGSTVTAKRIMATAADSLKRCSFECGGKAPVLVFDDADLERTAELIGHAAFRSTGQSCTQAGRLIVQRGVVEEFTELLAARAASVVAGPPFDSSSDIGPQVSEGQLSKTMEYIGLGRDEGYPLVHGGSRPPDRERGYFVQPTIFSNVPNSSRLAQEEIFGPVTLVIPFDDEEEAIELANDVRYGLVAGVFTKSLTRAHRCADAIESGTVALNTYRPVHWMLPYGGVKESGLGRESGLESIHEYVETKTVVVDLAE